MRGIDRREFLWRAGGTAVAGGLVPAGLELVRPTDAAGRVDRRLRSLARELRGPLYRPGSHGYALGRVFNRRYAGVAPLAVAEPEGVGDVQKCVRWAQRHGVRLVARAGGHSYAGYSTGRGALQLDLRRMSGVRVERGSSAVRIGAGAKLVHAQAALAAHGAAIPTGTCPTVGLTGLALGGGNGLASRQLGLTCDNLLELGVVLADGRFVKASERENADLLWACRGGGGGNFGVVTSLRLHAHRVRNATRF